MIISRERTLMNFKLFNRKGKVILHIGLHKTATTYFQNILEHNVEKLKKHNITYMNLKTTRELITRPIRNQKNISSIFTNITPYLNNGQLIISDENMIGELGVVPKNDFYQQLDKKMCQLMKLFDGFEVDIYVTLRNYSEYMPSRYSEYLRHFKFLEYDEYYNAMEYDRDYFLELTKRLSSFDINRLVISDFDNIIKNKEKYIQSLIGQKVQLSYKIDISQEIKRSTISQEVYDVLKYTSQKLGTDITSEVLEVIDTNYSSVKQPLNVIDSVLKKKLDSKYQDELQRIKELPYITFLEF